MDDGTIKLEKLNNDIDYGIFNIMLTEKKVIIGTIMYNFKYSSGFTYSGNVSYNIIKQFQNKGYATRSLKILKKYITKLNFDKDKTLYITIDPKNNASRNVIKNCNGNLEYKGKVPENDILYLEDGIENVEVYKIKM